MKFWTLSIAVLAFAAVASAGNNVAPSTRTLTSGTHTIIAPSDRGGKKDDDGGKGHGHGGGGQCVPEPLTMFGLVPGVAMLLRRRKKA
jgi:hypothetical protein